MKSLHQTFALMAAPIPSSRCWGLATLCQAHVWSQRRLLRERSLFCMINPLVHRSAVTTVPISWSTIKVKEQPCQGRWSSGQRCPSLKLKPGASGVAGGGQRGRGLYLDKNPIITIFFILKNCESRSYKMLPVGGGEYKCYFLYLSESSKKKKKRE